MRVTFSVAALRVENAHAEVQFKYTHGVHNFLLAKLKGFVKPKNGTGKPYVKESGFFLDISHATMFVKHF